jgi:branched-chain amino acid transport system substrate-binding protein
VLDALDSGKSVAGPSPLQLSAAVVSAAGLDPLDGYEKAGALASAARPGEAVTEEAVSRQLRGLPYVIRPAKPGASRLSAASVPTAPVPKAWVMERRGSAQPSSPARPQLAFIGVIGVLALAVASAAGLWWSQQGAGALPSRAAVVPADGPTSTASGSIATSPAATPAPSRNRAGVLPAGPWIIGAQLPLTGPDADFGESLRRGVQLAVDEANAARGIGGQKIELDARDEGVVPEVEPAAASMNDFVGNSKVIGVVGPAFSIHARADIPISNADGLLMCSPSNTAPNLTNPGLGAVELRPAYPERITFVRLATSDDIQGPAAATFARALPPGGVPVPGTPSSEGLGAKSALVIDDGSTGGLASADSFQEAFGASGGEVVRRSLTAEGADLPTLLQPLSVLADPKVVYFGGYSPDASDVKKALVAAGYADVPLLSWDGLYDGSGAAQNSYINITGAEAANTYVTRVSVAPMRADFKAHYNAAFGDVPVDPDNPLLQPAALNDYTAAAYACTQVMLDALRAAADASTSASELREFVRAYVTDTSRRFDTALGNVGFDANGDSTSQYVTVYGVDTGALGGKGDWVFLLQQDFGPIPN